MRSIKSASTPFLFYEKNGHQKTQRDMKVHPGTKLHGTTFDANHLDLFLHTEYGGSAAQAFPLSPTAGTAGLKGKPNFTSPAPLTQQSVAHTQLNIR